MRPRASGLRHGLAAVPVHLVAEQAYCERKVDLGLDFPELDRAAPEASAGAAGHEALAAAAAPVTTAELSALVEAGESVRLHEYGLLGSVGGVPLAGRPDAVFLDGRVARLVLEFKFSSWRRPFPSHRLQLLAYGHLLGQNGYDVSRLVCGVLMLPPAPDGGAGFTLPEADYASVAAHAAAFAARAEARTPYAAPEPVGGGTLSLFPYDPAEAARRLDWAIGYWTGRRSPRLADNPNKCRRCVFLEARLCGGSLAVRPT